MNVKHRSIALVAIVLGTTSASVLFQNKALAGYPSSYSYAVNLSVDRNQCMEKASKAASLVLPELQEPIVHEHGISQFGNTRNTTTTISCIDRSLGSTLTVVSSGDSFDDGTKNEAQSIRDRIMQVLASSL